MVICLYGFFIFSLCIELNPFDFYFQMLLFILLRQPHLHQANIDVENIIKLFNDREAKYFRVFFFNTKGLVTVALVHYLSLDGLANSLVDLISHCIGKVFHTVAQFDIRLSRILLLYINK